MIHMSPLELFYFNQPEPLKSCMLVMKDIILSQRKGISNEWKYGMPFFCFKGKMFCYLWVHKKHNLPYLGIVEGNRFDYPYMLKENRSRMKILLLNPEKNLPVKQIKNLLREVLSLYDS